MAGNHGWESRPYGCSQKVPEKTMSGFFTVGDFSSAFSPLLSVLVQSWGEGREVFGQESQQPVVQTSHLTSHPLALFPISSVKVLRKIRWGSSQHPAIPANAPRLVWSRPVAFQSQLLQSGFTLSCWAVMETRSPFNLRQLGKGGDRISYCFPKLI